MMGKLVVRRGGSGGGPIGLTVRAMARARKISEPDALAIWKVGGRMVSEGTLSLKQWQVAMARDAVVAKHIAEIKVEEAKAAGKVKGGPSIDDLFA